MMASLHDMPDAEDKAAPLVPADMAQDADWRTAMTEAAQPGNTPMFATRRAAVPESVR